MVQLIFSSFPGSVVFECVKTKRSVEVDVDGLEPNDEDWKKEPFMKAILTLVTGTDNSKLRESVEVVDKDGLRLYYLEKL